ncbi:MAG: tetratricopeptide repeat protein [Acaryochloris sp. CRU_2_0]|nr:tetratricopeptide repeat protein [Acaryochloris sp. CRU_2_0]
MHPSVRSLSLTTTIALLSLTGLSLLDLQPFVYSIAQGQTTAGNSRQGDANRVFLEGKKLFRQSQPTEALSKFQKALELYRVVKDRTGEVVALHNIGDVYSALGQKQQALAYYNQALIIHQAVGDRTGEADTLIVIGAVYSAFRS